MLVIEPDISSEIIFLEYMDPTELMFYEVGANHQPE